MVEIRNIDLLLQCVIDHIDWDTLTDPTVQNSYAKYGSFPSEAIFAAEIYAILRNARATGKILSEIKPDICIRSSQKRSDIAIRLGTTMIVLELKVQKFSGDFFIHFFFFFTSNHPQADEIRDAIIQARGYMLPYVEKIYLIDFVNTKWTITPPNELFTEPKMDARFVIVDAQKKLMEVVQYDHSKTPRTTAQAVSL